MTSSTSYVIAEELESNYQQSVDSRRGNSPSSWNKSHLNIVTPAINQSRCSSNASETFCNPLDNASNNSDGVIGNDADNGVEFQNGNTKSQLQQLRDQSVSSKLSCSNVPTMTSTSDQHCYGGEFDGSNREYYEMERDFRKEQKKQQTHHGRLPSDTAAETLEEEREEDYFIDYHQPSSLREFFRDFWFEFKDLIQELVEYGKAKNWKKKVLTVLVLICSLLVFYDLIFGNFIIQHIEHFIEWMSHHTWKAVLSFVGIFVVATLIFIPPSLLIFGAGFAFSQAIGMGWGIAAAILSCSIGSCIGAIIAFFRSRYMMRDLIYLFSKRYPLVRAADRALKQNGFRIMILLRLCPLLPFNGLNYICGVTGVGLEDFFMSLIGILPFQIFTVVVGATAGSFALSKGPGAQYSTSQKFGWAILLASGCFFGLLALVFTWKVVKKELRKELRLSPKQLDEMLHATQQKSERDIFTQGGIESSVEVGHLEQTSPDRSATSAEGESWAKDEEWFWIWA